MACPGAKKTAWEQETNPVSPIIRSVTQVKEKRIGGDCKKRLEDTEEVLVAQEGGRLLFQRHLEMTK